MQTIKKTTATSAYGFIFLLGVVVYTAFHTNSIFLDCDSPWHIAAGDYIRALGHIPLTDPWSFMTGQSRWYNLSWLYDIVVSWLHETLGLRGLVGLNILFACSIPVVLAKLCFMRGSSVVATFIACILALIMLKSGFSIRPQQVMFMIIALCLFVTFHYRQQMSPIIWFLPCLALLWANVHGSYLVMFTILGSYGLEALLRKDWPRVKTYFLVSLGCLLAMLVNPLGYHIFYASMLSLGGEYSQNYIAEWQLSTLLNAPHIYLNVIIALIVAYFYRKKLPMADVILVSFWGVMALVSIRYNAVFTLFLTPVLAVMLTGIFSSKQRVVNVESTLNGDFSQVRFARAMLGISLVVCALYFIPLTRNTIISNTLYDESRYPKQEINYLMANYPKQPILNNYCYGSYIIYQSQGRLSPFIDTRLDSVYPENAKRIYFKELYKPGLDNILDKYGIKAAIFEKDNEKARAAFKRIGWAETLKGPVASIYEKSAQ